KTGHDFEKDANINNQLNKEMAAYVSVQDAFTAELKKDEVDLQAYGETFDGRSVPLRGAQIGNARSAMDIFVGKTHEGGFLKIENNEEKLGVFDEHASNAPTLKPPLSSGG